ncbi:hypothetical protein [Oricola cellulosilytica]|uniref:gluconokinase n=1 Tax=Oricola cellulosilytica TaxID=1429082 RepID=A0A4R0P4R9_9HYPH|nr:hypothetical protein [Oricola cellulosilytica]TCD11871.1 hypothetical protein E0D97_16180 [Oricola cellulosilytica]
MGIVFLHGSAEVIEERLALRTDHFAAADLLPSQLGDLQPPTVEEGAFCQIDITPDMQTVVSKAEDFVRQLVAGAGRSRDADAPVTMQRQS